MRKLISTLSLIVIVICSYGQDDTLPYHDDNIRIDTAGYGLSAPEYFLDSWYGWYISDSDLRISIKRDTIPIIMLCVDTAANAGWNVSVSKYYCYSLFGYGIVANSWSTIGYLDSKKKPLSKNIIIWLSKKINQQ